jgi:hypothetical protein
VNQAISLVDEAEKKGLTLRMLGASAIRLHCPRSQSLLNALKRKITDIDLAAYGKQKTEVVRFLTEHNYRPRQHLTIGAFVGREIFERADGTHVDVFFDKLEYCHTIYFKNRLEKDRPTVPLSELVLEKSQIVQINEKDLKDLTIMFLEHEIGEADGETINVKEIASTLSNDWGFYYTFTMNVAKVKDYMQKYGILTDKDKQLINQRIASLLEYVESAPKSTGWKVRARVGPRKKWYRDVEEVDRADWLSADGSRGN